MAAPKSAWEVGSKSDFSLEVVEECQVQVRAFNRLYYLSAKLVQSVKGPHLYLTKQESSWRDCWVLVGFGPDPYCP